MPKSVRARRPLKERHAIFLYVALLVVLTILIVAAAARKPVLIMPPELPELAEKRASPQNTYHQLHKITSLVPHYRPEPVFVPDPRHPGKQVPYEPEAGSIGALLSIQRPDDDEELRTYVARCTPEIMIARIRELIQEHRYYLHPMTPEKRLESVLVGTRSAVAYAVQRARNGHDDEEAFEYLFDVVRIGRLIASDGPVSAYWKGVFAASAALTHVDDVAVCADSSEVVRSALNQVIELEPADYSLTPYIEFEWRLLDCEGYADRVSPERYGRSIEGSVKRLVEDAVFAWDMRKVRKYIRDNKQALFEATRVPCYDLSAWLAAHLPQGGAGLVNHYFHDIYLILANGRAWEKAAFGGARIALALDLYRRDHGQYPDTLDALMPEYLDAIPGNPFDGKAFTYEAKDGDYTLFPARARRGITEWRRRRDTQLVFRRPPAKPGAPAVDDNTESHNGA